MIHILVLAFLLFLPGLAVNLWLTLRKTGLFTLLIESAGLSLALMALLAQLGFWLGVRFSAIAIWIILVLCALSVMAAVRLRKLEISLHKEDWIGLGLLAAVTLWRFFQIDGLVLPAWVDSVHHTLIVQTILSTGGLPQDLTPVLQVPFFYHYVFHVFGALLAGLGHLQPYQAVLWAGQAINSLAVIGVYRLSMALWNDYKKAGLAVILAGFVLEMPAFYLAWGRYTLLTGLVFLPLALAAAVGTIKHPSRTDWVLLAFFTAGSFLSHYLAGLLLLLGIGLLLFVDWLEQRKTLPRKLAWNVILGCAVGMLLALPWLWRAWSFTRRYAQITTDSYAMDSWTAWFNLLGPWRNGLIMVIALAGLVLVLVKSGRRWFGVWSFCLLFFSLPLGLRWGPFRPDHFSILLWLPAALLASYALVEGASWLASRSSKPWPWIVLSVLTLGFVVWGQVQMCHLVDDHMILADQADIAAADWIGQNLPEDARFLINTTLWQTASYRGVDGGYWLPVLTGRQTVLPPAMYGYGTAEYIRQINAWAETASRLTTCGDEFLTLVGSADLDYIYLSDGQGSLQMDGLVDCPNLTILYQQDGINILSIQR
jgi:hypothetical protein